MSDLIWKTEKRKIFILKPASYNPRKATEKQMKDLSDSLDKFSIADPIIINKDNTVIGGHMRLKILKDKKVKEVDVRVPNRQLTAPEEKELNIRLNKNLGEFDNDLLKNFDDKMLSDIGFTEEDFLNISDEDIEEKEEELIEPFKKIHFLISIPIDGLTEIQPLVEQIKSITGVEIEQSAN